MNKVKKVKRLNPTIKANKTLSIDDHIPSPIFQSYDEFSKALKLFNKDEKRSLKALPTKKTIVKDKTKGAYVRNQHVTNKKDQPNQKNNKQDDVAEIDDFEIVDDDAFDFTDKDITRTNEVTTDSITNGIKKIDANGKSFYAKPVAGETLTYKAKKDGKERMVRHSIKLNSRETNTALPDVTSHKNLKGEEKRDKLKGTMADREVMSYKLAEQLGFDHIPRAEKKMLNGKEHVVIQDVQDAFGDKYQRVQDKMQSVIFDNENIMDKVKRDPKLADKIVYDFMIGNTDRHTGNMFAGTKKNGQVDFIGIDQGLAFPDNNRAYMIQDYRNQLDFTKLVDNPKGNMSDDLFNKLEKWIGSEAYVNYTRELHQEVGKNETIAFTDRVNSVLKAGREARKNKR